jgi:hypothetical protein
MDFIPTSLVGRAAAKNLPEAGGRACAEKSRPELPAFTGS